MCVTDFDWGERLGADLASMSDKAARKKQLKELAAVRERLLAERARLVAELAEVAHSEMRDASQQANRHLVLRLREAIGLSRAGRVFALRVGDVAGAAEWGAAVQVPLADTVVVDVLAQDGNFVGSFSVTLAKLGPDLDSGNEMMFETHLDAVPGSTLIVGVRRK